MPYISHSNAITVSGNIWLVNARKSGIYTQMAKRMIEQVDAMMAHYPKIHILRFDLRQRAYTPSNRAITDFNRRLHGRLQAHYQVKRVGFIWVRETERSDHQHYHYALLLDGRKIQFPHKVLEWATEIWELMDGSVWQPRNCYYNVQRNDHQQLQAAIFRISYLAKARGKGHKPQHTKNYGTSRIKPPL